MAIEIEVMLCSERCSCTFVSAAFTAKLDSNTSSAEHCLPDASEFAAMHHNTLRAVIERMIALVLMGTM